MSAATPGRQSTPASPVASRPEMPAGYGVPSTDEGILPWSWATERLISALTYWIGTTRPNGRPHAMPLWGAWLDDTFYFEGGPDTRRGRNLATNPAVVVHIEQGDEIVILEGTAGEVVAPESSLAKQLADVFAAKYGAKYDYRPDPSSWDSGGLYAVRSQVVFGWSVAGFPNSTTRWRFDG